MRGRCSGAALLFAALGCSAREVDSDPPLFVSHVLAPANRCAWEPDVDWPTLQAGSLDLALRSSYRAVFLVGNRFPGLPRSVSLTGADVEIWGSGGELVASASVPTGGFIEPSSKSESGWGLAEVRLIDEALGDHLRKQLPLDDGRIEVESIIRLYGTTFDGKWVESLPFTFPLELCHGCLIEYPPESDAPWLDGYQCANTESYAEQESCFIGQDVPVNCLLCAATHPICLCPGCD